MPARKMMATGKEPRVKSSGKPKSRKPVHARVAETTARPYNTLRETQVTASDFKTRCLELMDTVRDRRETIIITKRGAPVAKLVPVEEKRPNAVGSMKGTVLWYGDLISPIDVEWDANK